MRYLFKLQLLRSLFDTLLVYFYMHSLQDGNFFVICEFSFVSMLGKITEEVCFDVRDNSTTSIGYMVE